MQAMKCLKAGCIITSILFTEFAEALPINGQLITLGVSGAVSAGLSFDSLVKSQTNLSQTLAIDGSTSPSFIYFGRSSQVAVLPFAHTYDLTFKLEISGVERFPAQVPSVNPTFGGYLIQFFADYPYTDQPPTYFWSRGISTYHPGFSPEEINSYFPIPSQSYPFSTIAPISVGHLEGPAAVPLGKIGIYLSSTPVYENANYDLSGNIEATLSTSGNAQFEVSDPRLEFVRQQAMLSIQNGEKIFELAKWADLISGALTIGNFANSFQDGVQAGKTAQEQIADAIALAGAIEDVEDWRFNGKDFFQLGNPGADQLGFQSLENELRSIGNNPLNAIDWALGTRSITFLEEASIPLVHKLLNDPPRFDYGALYEATPMTLSQETSMLLSESERAYIESRAFTLALMNSIYVANERYQGAMIDGNSVAAAAQAELIMKNSLLLDQELLKTNALLAQLVDIYRETLLAKYNLLDLVELSELTINSSEWLDPLFSYDVFGSSEQAAADYLKWFLEGIPSLASTDILSTNYNVVSPYLTPAAARALNLEDPGVVSISEPPVWAMMIYCIALFGLRFKSKGKHKLVQ